MTTAQDMLGELDRLGIQYRLDGSDLKLKGPIPPQLVERLKEHKAEIVAALTAPRVDACKSQSALSADDLDPRVDAFIGFDDAVKAQQARKRRPDPDDPGNDLEN